MSLYLPPEIVTDILSRLPVKSLVRFRCVSKPWCSLIDTPDFAKMHLHQSVVSKSNRNITLRFIDSSVGSIELSSLDSPGVDSIDCRQCFQPPVTNSYVFGTCNGLCHLLKKISKYAYKNYIWNPYTRKYRELPAISFDFKGLPSFVRLTENHGFAYVSETDDYKVVHVTEIRGFDSSYIGNQVYIFSSRSNEWERVEPFPYQMMPTRPLEAPLNGVLHIVIEKDFSQWGLMAFDTKTKQHSMLPKPDFASVMIEEVQMDVLEGNLCLQRTWVINSVDVRMDLWVMKDYGVEASWFKLFSLALDPGANLTTNPLIMNYSKVGAEILLSDNVKKLIWYNSRGERLREVMVNVSPLEFFGEVWYESLVSFPGFISVDDEKAKGQGNDRKGKKEDDVNKQSQQKRLKDKGNTSSIKGFLSQGFKLKL